MARIQIPTPLGGVSEDLGFSDQPQGTSQDADNVRAVDPPTGRKRLSVRPGTKRFNDSQVSGSNKIAALHTITYPLSNQALADLGNSLAIEWSKTNTVTGDTLGIQCGTQGDSISLDGATGIMKRNRDGALMWKITLAAKDKNHVVRALLVDASTPGDLGSDFVFAGVSTGGDSTTAKAWAYRQLNENKVEKVWELDPGGYVEGFTITKDKLFLLCNFPDQNRSYIIAYDDYLTNSPTEVNRWTVPTNATSIDSGTQDGFIFTTHDASSDRDTRFGSRGSTWASEDWTIKDLPSYKERVWCDLNAALVDTVAIEPRSLSYPGAGDTTAPPGDLLDGGNVRMWQDSSGNGRNLYQTAHRIPLHITGAYNNNTVPASRGAIFRSNGTPAGTPALAFDGTTCGLISESPSSVSAENSDSNLSLIPSYKGAQHATFILCNISPDAVHRVLLAQGYDQTSNYTDGRFIAVNNPGNSYPTDDSGDEVPGAVTLYEASGIASDTSQSTTAAQAPHGSGVLPLGGGIPASGWCLITWICDGGRHDVSGTATRSQFRINGHPCDRWQSAAFSTLLPTTLGYMPSTDANARTAPFIGSVARILVLRDWRDKDGVYQALLGTGSEKTYQYPDIAWDTDEDSNLERIEGWLMHSIGIAHEAPGGVYGTLKVNLLPAAAETVQVGATTYTFRSTFTAAVTANEVKIVAADIPGTLANLARAINGTGEEGTDYTRTTVPNSRFRAYAPVARTSYLYFTGATVTDAGAGNTVVSIPTLTDFASTAAGGSIIDASASTVVFTSVTGGAVAGSYPTLVHSNADVRIVEIGSGAASANGTASGYVVLPVTYAMMVRSRNPNRAVAAEFAETLTDGLWSSANSAVVGQDYNLGWYPHPFFLDRTARTYGGPPRTAGVTTTSKYWLLRSPYPIVAAWDPVNGKAKDVLTSNYDDNGPTGSSAGTGVGGIGYNVRCGSSGFIYTCGPRATVVGSGAAWGTYGFGADAIDARKIIWTNQGFQLQGTGYWLWGPSNGSTVSPGALTYGFPRMAVDKYDNLFLPYSGAGSSSLFIFDKDGSGANAVVISAYASLPDSNEGYAVAVDPIYPDFALYASLERAEYCVLGTQATGASRNTVFRLRTLSSTPTSAAPRATKLLAVCNGTVRTVTPSAISGSLGSLDTTTALYMWTNFLGKSYVTDGRQTMVYDPKAGTLTAHVATSGGGVPKNYALIATWNNSLVFARNRDNPNQYVISAQGDAGGFDTDPYTISAAQAIKGSDGSAGVPPDSINAFIPWFDDLAIIGGDRSIYRITGRPSPGSDGSIHLVSSSIGIAFGKAWCLDSNGMLYFFGSRGGVYKMSPGGLPVPLKNRIHRRLQDIDLTLYRIEMVWNDRDNGFHVIVCPYGAGGTVVDHFFYDTVNEAWWPDNWVVSTIQPTCVGVFDGDDPDDRKVLFGCEDGRIRTLDGTVEADDVILASGVPTYPINARVLIGPMAPKDVQSEVLFSALEAVLANDQDGQPWCAVYVTDRADYLGTAVWSGQLKRGRNPFVNFRWRGSFVFIELRSSDRYGRWAIEQLSIEAEAMGMKRMVTR